MKEEDQDQAGKRDGSQQERGDVNNFAPGLTGIAAFVQIIDDGDEAGASFGNVVGACTAVDYDVSFVAGTFEGDRTLGIFDAEIVDGAVDALAPQVFDYLELIDRAFQPSGVE